MSYGCRHCEPRHEKGRTQMGDPMPCLDEGEFMDLVTSTRMLVAYHDRYMKPGFALKINYCPMCGRSLVDE